MARRKTKKKVPDKSGPESKSAPRQGWFAMIACETSRIAGKPATFLIATSAVILWAISGPLFGFSDTWQLVINTSTTNLTFLMVFLIQNTQNRDSAAVQIKLDELIFRMHGADNKIAGAEELSDEELEHLHANYQQRAHHVLTSLSERKAGKTKSRAA